MFRNRDDAAYQLVQYLEGRVLLDPLVLAIPCGGVLIGSVLARELHAELDVVAAAKLYAPGPSRSVIGAVSEDGQISVNREAQRLSCFSEEYIRKEAKRQLVALTRRTRRFRDIRPAAPIMGRSVIVADDGLLTGSTMIAALKYVTAQEPHEVIVAVPVASAQGLPDVHLWCQDAVWLVNPEMFQSIDQFYEAFPPVEDKDVAAVLREFAPAPAIPGRKTRRPLRTFG